MNDLYRAEQELDAFREFVPSLPLLRLVGPWLIPSDWEKKSFPNASLPGVYLFQDASGNIIYIGKSSVGLGQRIGGAYLGQGGRIKDKKIMGATKLYTVALPKKLSFLAPALEEFLISRLDPEGNTIGRRIAL